VLKDIKGNTQFLLIPTGELSGIESPSLLTAGSPNYFEDAWEARRYINDVLHKTLPREDISLAINSVASRSQDQLHIHVDCVRADVRDALKTHVDEIKNQWTPMAFVLPEAHRYKALWVSGENLGMADPFKLVAQGIQGAANDMGDQTIAVIGATRKDGIPGFIVLDDQVSKLKADFAHSEELQDHECKVGAEINTH